MKRDEKDQTIETLVESLGAYNTIYLTDISNLNATDTSDLRRLCFKRNIKLQMVKNTLLKQAMTNSEKELEGLYDVLVGNTSVMFAEAGNAPAKLIKEFRKTNKKPILKGAFVEESIYIGDENLDKLTEIKSKDELIADVLSLLQAPIRNVMGALQSGSNNITGVLKTLSEKE